MNVEVEIYMTNLQKFFRNNPKDLLSLIPQGKEDVFYQKIREKVVENLENNKDVTLTQKQLIEICVEINSQNKKTSEPVVGIFQKTKFGEICLN
jgi:hypothetical protein